MSELIKSVGRKIALTSNEKIRLEVVKTVPIKLPFTIFSKFVDIIGLGNDTPMDELGEFHRAERRYEKILGRSVSVERFIMRFSGKCGKCNKSHMDLQTLFFLEDELLSSRKYRVKRTIDVFDGYVLIELAQLLLASAFMSKESSFEEVVNMTIGNTWNVREVDVHTNETCDHKVHTTEELLKRLGAIIADGGNVTMFSKNHKNALMFNNKTTPDVRTFVSRSAAGAENLTQDDIDISGCERIHDTPPTSM